MYLNLKMEGGSLTRDSDPYQELSNLNAHCSLRGLVCIVNWISKIWLGLALKY